MGRELQLLSQGRVGEGVKEKVILTVIWKDIENGLDQAAMSTKAK